MLAVFLVEIFYNKFQAFNLISDDNIIKGVITTIGLY